jgi:hypothetical protein
MVFLKKWAFEIVLLALLSTCGASMLIFGESPTLDRKFSYTHEEAVALMAAKSPEAIGRYKLHEVLDTFFLVLYSAFSCALLKRNTTNSKLMSLGLLPGIFDLLETWTILGVLYQQFPLPLWLGTLTTIKWLCAYGVIGFIVILSVKKSGRSSK